MCINDITRDGAIVDTQDEEASETIGTTSTSSISSLSKKKGSITSNENGFVLGDDSDGSMNDTSMINSLSQACIGISSFAHHQDSPINEPFNHQEVSKIHPNVFDNTPSALQ